MRKITILLSAVFLLMFTGCSMADMRQIYEEKLGEYILQTSNIIEDDSYIQYTELAEEGRLDEEGRYNELGEYEEFTADRNAAGNGYESSEKTEENKQVHITFAENSYLSVRYYYDEDLKEPLQSAECYLNPGESLYASQPECRNPYTNFYVFSEFRVYEYDSEGNRERIPHMTSRTGTVLTIPEDFTGTELSVEPVGEYQRRLVTFEAYTIDRNGKRSEVAGGSWKVNDETCVNNRKELNPNETAVIRYCYNPEEYYLVNSEPKCYSDMGGIVEFSETTAMDRVDSYSVQLSPYCLALLEGESDGIKKIDAVKVNNRDYNGGDPLKEKEIGHLKAGDKVLVETTDNYRLFSMQVELGEESLGSGRYRYSFTVPEGNEQIRLYVGKSELEISVAGNVGNEITFDIEAGGSVIRDLVYKKQSFGRAYTIFDGTIGMTGDIVISAKGHSLPADHALRFDITGVDGNGNETKVIVYITELPGSQTVELYKGGSAENFSRIYRSTDIEIELVETMVYRQETIEHGTITVRYSKPEGEDVLKDGGIAEVSRDVDMVIKPEQGYYVSGKKVKDDSFTDSMTFKKYNSSIAEIIEAHPVKKYIQVIFDTADEYGNCVFKLDGKEIGGEGSHEPVSLKEGQTVTLEYNLTNSEYQIIRESEVFFDGLIDWGASIISKNKISIKIEITEELDGSVITRESYIRLEKK